MPSFLRQPGLPTLLAVLIFTFALFTVISVQLQTRLSHLPPPPPSSPLLAQSSLQDSFLQPAHTQFSTCLSAPPTVLDLTRPFSGCWFQHCFSRLSRFSIQSCALSLSNRLPQSCNTILSQPSQARLYVAPQEPLLLRQIHKQLLSDASFPIGMGVTLVESPHKADADIILSQSTLFSPPLCQGRTRILSLARDSSIDPHIDVNQGHPSLMYGAVRSAVGEALLPLRGRPQGLHLAMLLVWAGSKPPPRRLITVAKDLQRVGADVLLFVEAAYVDTFAALVDGQAVRVVTDIPFERNLTRFMHTRLDELVPELKGHEHYPLGWGLCDLRWLFGDLFQHWLAGYSHWAWVDSDALASSNLLSSWPTDYGWDLVNHDVVSFASFGTGKDFYVTTMQAYTSGTLTIVKNTAKGRQLYRQTPLAALVEGLSKAKNNLLDEAFTSNAVLGAPNVSVVLTTSQARNKHVERDAQGLLWYAPSDPGEQRELLRLAEAGRWTEPWALASLGQATVKGRFVGGKPLANQGRPAVTASSFEWYAEPHVDAAAYVFNQGIGTGFASLIRDETGAWWHRPIPWQALTFRDNALVKVQVGVAHVRGGGSGN